MDAGDAGADELTHRPHGVQRLAKAGAGVDDQRQLDAAGHVLGQLDLLVIVSSGSVTAIVPPVT